MSTETKYFITAITSLLVFIGGLFFVAYAQAQWASCAEGPQPREECYPSIPAPPLAGPTSPAPAIPEISPAPIPEMGSDVPETNLNSCAAYVEWVSQLEGLIETLRVRCGSRCRKTFRAYNY